MSNLAIATVALLIRNHIMNINPQVLQILRQIYNIKLKTQTLTIIYKPQNSDRQGISTKSQIHF